MEDITINNIERLYLSFQSFRMNEETYLNAIKEVINNHFNNEKMSERTLDLLTTDPIKEI